MTIGAAHSAPTATALATRPTPSVRSPSQPDTASRSIEAGASSETGTRLREMPDLPREQHLAHQRQVGDGVEDPRDDRAGVAVPHPDDHFGQVVVDAVVPERRHVHEPRRPRGARAGHRGHEGADGGRRLPPGAAQLGTTAARAAPGTRPGRAPRWRRRPASSGTAPPPSPTSPSASASSPAAVVAKVAAVNGAFEPGRREPGRRPQSRRGECRHRQDQRLRDGRSSTSSLSPCRR